MQKLARTLLKHEPLLLNWFESQRLTSGIVEGFNNKAKLTMRTVQWPCRPGPLSDFGQFPSAGAEGAGFDSEFSQHADVEIRERIVFGLVECNVSGMFETAACEYDRQVGGGMGGTVAEVANREYLGLIQQGSVRLLRLGELRQQVVEQLVVSVFIKGDLFDLAGIFPVM
jgi:hypothetical protein